MKTSRSPLSMTCPLVFGSGWGFHVLSPSGPVLVALFLWLPPASPALSVAGAKFPPLAGLFCPFWPLSQDVVGALNRFLTCLRLEAEAGTESKALSTLAAVSDQDPLLCLRTSQPRGLCGHLWKALPLLQLPCLVILGPDAPFCPFPSL